MKNAPSKPSCTVAACARRALLASRCASHVHVYMCVLTQHASHRRVYAHARV